MRKTAKVENWAKVDLQQFIRMLNDNFYIEFQGRKYNTRYDWTKLVKMWLQAHEEVAKR